jgi:hypothetical protein
MTTTTDNQLTSNAAWMLVNGLLEELCWISRHTSDLTINEESENGRSGLYEKSNFGGQVVVAQNLPN